MKLNRGTLARLIISISFVIVGLGAFREWYIYTFGTDTIVEDLRQIALDSEHCLGSYYSSLLMVAAAVMMGIIARSREAAERWRKHWLLLSLLFVILSIDESVSFHEVLIDPLRQAFGFSGFLTFAWIVPAAIFVLLLGMSYAPFLFAMEDPLRLQLVLAGTIYIVGALGFEAVSGHFYAISGNTSPHYVIAALVEESLEVAGLTILVVSLASEFCRRRTRLVLSVATDQPLETVVEGAAQRIVTRFR